MGAILSPFKPPLRSPLPSDKNFKEISESIIEKNSHPCIQSLLDAGLDINALNDGGTTMLSYAAECGYMEIIEFLVHEGADGNVMNADGSKPLHMAAMYGHIDIVKFFINLGVFVDSCDNKQCTPLHYAVQENVDAEFQTVDSFLELAQFLVDSKANLNAVDDQGNTPLLLAYHKPVVDLLIKSGGDVGCCNKSQWTLLHHSSRNGWFDIVKYLVERGYDIDINTRGGYTPLILAAEYAHKDIVEFLIKSGANIEGKGFSNNSVLHSACIQGWFNIVKYLVIKGLDINAKDSHGHTPFLLAARYSHFYIVEYLLTFNVNIDYSDNDGFTVLHYTYREGWLDVVPFLIKKGCDVNARERCWGSTPLHAAAQVNNLEMMRCLLEAGADYNLKNFGNKTAFNYLIGSPLCLEGILLFLENGAHIQSNDYFVIRQNPLLKEGILQDIALCTLSIMNKFNNADLPKIYKVPAVAERLPPIEKMKIANNTKVAHDIAQNVKYEIQTNGYCNLLNARPIVLHILCVASLVEHY